MINCKSQYVKCKEGLIIKHGEVDISRIRTAVKINAIYLDTKQLTIMPSMQLDQNGHSSHLSDLPSQDTLLGHSTICDIVTYVIGNLYSYDCIVPQ